MASKKSIKKKIKSVLRKVGLIQGKPSAPFLRDVVEQSGLDQKTASRLMEDAKSLYGVSNKEFLEGKLWKLPTKQLKADPKSFNTWIDGVARYRAQNFGERLDGVEPYTAEKDKIRDYRRVHALMYDLRKKYGISYSDFTKKDYYKIEDEAKIEEKVKAWTDHRKEFNLKKTMEATGWTREEAIEKIEATIKKFPTLTYRNYAYMQLFNRSDEEIAALVKKWNDREKERIAIVMNATGWDKQKVRRHMRRYNIYYGITSEMYILFRAWELTDEQVNSFSRTKISAILDRNNNGPNCNKIMSSKLLFDKEYADLTRRKVWENVDTSFEEFREFTNGLTYIFCKPISAGGGNGARKIMLPDNEEDLKKLYDELMSTYHMAVEEGIVQHPMVEAITPGCVSTVRVVAIKRRKTGEVKILCAHWKFGRGGLFTDNLASGSFLADLDINTGEVITDGADESGNTYVEHPDTHVKIKGLKVPNWDQMKGLITEAMNRVDDARYIGWDVAILKDGFALVEGNTQPDLTLAQLPYINDRIGRRFLFDPYLPKGSLPTITK